MNSDDLRSLLESGNYDEILAVDYEMTEQSMRATLCFFQAETLKRLSRHDEALTLVEKGLELNPNNYWAHQIRFEALKAAHRIDEALNNVSVFVRTAGAEADALRRIYIDTCIEQGKFAEAVNVNEQRSVISRAREERARYVLAVQCFNKADTLEKVFESLIKLRSAGNFALSIVQDCSVGSQQSAVFLEPSRAVTALIADWLPRLASHFHSVQFSINRTNLGTAPTCRKLLDSLTESYLGFLFIEDDCVLAIDALEWAEHHLKNSISGFSNWFVTCESIFFDGQVAQPNASSTSVLREFADRPDVRHSYVMLNFLPSTCFATTTEIWKSCSKIRSFPEGPESLSKYLNTLRKRTLSPVVPRAADIGMLHELGYSVTKLGKDGVKEAKATYLMSETERFDPSQVMPYRGDEDVLFAASVKLIDSAIFRLRPS